MKTIEPPRSAEAECSNADTLLERSTERLHQLLPNDPELQRALPSEEALEAIRSHATTIESVAKAFEVYADRACLGERALESTSAEDGEVRLLQKFRTCSYSEVWARVCAFASGLSHEKLATTGNFVGICGFGSTDWVVADLACLYLAAVSVPLQTGVNAADLQQIINETELVCIVCSAAQIDAIEAVLPQCPSVRSVVVMDLSEGGSSSTTHGCSTACDRSRWPSRLSRTERSADSQVRRPGDVACHRPSAAHDGVTHSPAEPARGRWIRKVVPWPISDSIAIVPPHASTMRFTMARPRPVPVASFDRCAR